MRSCLLAALFSCASASGYACGGHDLHLTDAGESCDAECAAVDKLAAAFAGAAGARAWA